MSLALGLALAGCGAEPYVIGAYDPPEPPEAQETLPSLSISLATSGTSRLEARFESLELDLEYRGERAVAEAWPAEAGPALARASTVGLALGVDAPFTDGTRAVRMAEGGAHYRASTPEVGDLDRESSVLELIFRASDSASIVAKRAGGRGWSLELSPDPRLTLVLEDGASASRVASVELASDAWTHCFAFIDRERALGRIDCNGAAGAPESLASLGSLRAGERLVVGDNGAVDRRSLLAFLALHRAPAGLPEEAAQVEAGRRRFLQLAGALPEAASGSPLPRPTIRASAALLDLAREPGGPRRLHRVGANWPRIACRGDGAGGLGCGYLSEPARESWLGAPEPSAWSQEGVLVRARPLEVLDESLGLEGLVATPARAPHRLVRVQEVGAGRYVYSVFVRAGSSRKVALSIADRGLAVYDLAAIAADVVPPGVSAAIEDWGDGVRRCVYRTDMPVGEHAFRVHLLDDTGEESWAGDGVTVSHQVAAIGLDLNVASPLLPTGGGAQAADRLSFAADDGNVSPGEGAEIRARVLSPAGPRFTDGAIVNVNRSGAFADQLNLFVAGDGRVQFWGLRSGETRWSFGHPAEAADGRWHEVRGRWGSAGVLLEVDSAPESATSEDAAGTQDGLDRIDVGFSDASSGHFDGLIGHLSISR